VKIVAPGLEDVVAGSMLRTSNSEKQAKEYLEEMKEEQENVEITSNEQGLILKADTVGGLEALIHIFRNHKIRQATIGNVTKSDVMSAEANKDFFYKAIIVFNSKVSDETRKMAADRNINIIDSDVIYRLIESYDKWKEDEEKRQKEKEIENVTRPGRIRLLPGCTFRASNPAIIGCEVVEGMLKPGYALELNNVSAGSVKQIQSEGQNVSSASRSEKVAVSIDGPTVGRQIKEGDELVVSLSENDYKQLMRHIPLLAKGELQLLENFFEYKRKYNPRWGL